MKKINWKNVRLALMVCAVFALFLFSTMKNEQRKITKHLITILDEETPFLSQEVVNKLLIQNNFRGPNVSKDAVNLRVIERSLEENEMVNKAEVFVTIDGILNVNINQKTPLVRVVSDSVSYYIDSNSNIMPLSKNYSARVPLVSGEIHQDNKNNYFELFKFIREDDFLSKNIIGVHIQKNGGVVLKNRNYNYSIYFGSPINISRKFYNYKAFFQKAIKDGTIVQYNWINLKFTQQVVCAK